MIKKAVFPVAGLGSRFLPATKANPKEMLPIVDKPLIQYAVEEAISAGITELIFVTSSKKRAIEDHFDTQVELEYHLAAAKKDDLLRGVENILPSHVSCVYVRQPIPLGLGDAVLRAQPIVGDDDFVVMLADDLIAHTGPSCLAQMLNRHATVGGNMVAVQHIAKQEARKYGVIAVSKEQSKQAGCLPVSGIVEKPEPSAAPSNFGVVGRYILQASIFEALAQLPRGISGEVQLTDAIARLLCQGQALHAYEFAGQRFDCGSQLGYVQATIAYALGRPELAEPLLTYLREQVEAHTESEWV